MCPSRKARAFFFFKKKKKKENNLVITSFGKSKRLSKPVTSLLLEKSILLL